MTLLSMARLVIVALLCLHMRYSLKLPFVFCFFEILAKKKDLWTSNVQTDIYCEILSYS